MAALEAVATCICHHHVSSLLALKLSSLWSDNHSVSREFAMQITKTTQWVPGVANSMNLRTRIMLFYLVPALEANTSFCKAVCKILTWYNMFLFRAVMWSQ